MKTIRFIFGIMLIMHFVFFAYSQGDVGINTSSPSSTLEVVEDQESSTVTATTYRNTGFKAGQFIGRAARGTMAMPTALQENDVMASFNGRAYGTTGFCTLPRGRLAFIAAENWTDSEQGTYFTLTTTSIGTSSHTERIRVTSEGLFGIGTSNPLTLLQVAGNITFAPAGQSFDESRFFGQSIASQNIFDPNQGFGGMEIENLFKVGTDDSAQKLHFWTHDQGVDANRRMSIGLSGNVGIGETDPEHKLHIVQDNNSEQGLLVTQNGEANAGTFDIPNSSSTGHALNVYNNGSGYGLDLVIHSDGTGAGGRFSIDNPFNNKPAIYSEHNGIGNAGQFKILNATNNQASIYSSHVGVGNAGRFQINNPSSGAVALYALTNGTGPALGGNQNGDGTAGFFNINNSSNDNTVLEVKTLGGGSAAKFEISNGLSIDPVVIITGTGTGPSISADGLIDMAGFRMSTGASDGYILTSDGSGIGTWQTSSFDFADGGESTGANRSLGNTDNFALSLLTNNTNRLHITNDGKIGIGTISPAGILDIGGNYHFPNVDGTSGQVLKTDGSGTLSWGNDNDVTGATQINELSDGKTGGNSIFLGNSSGANDDLSDNRNIGIGTIAMASNYAGNNNIAIGYQTMLSNNGGNYNIGIGNFANQYNQTGSYNTIIGFEAGKGGGAHSKSGNVFLGYQAGFNEGGSNKLYIENSNSASPLLYGEFNNNLLRINGTLDINEAYHFPTLDGNTGEVLMTNGSGVLSWESSGGDFADGGEAGGADRSIGNTDAYDLSFLTNNTSRIKINDDGGVRIDGHIGVYTDPDIPSSAKSIILYDGVTYANPFMRVSGHNSASIHLESRRTSGTTNGKTWKIGSGSGSIFDLDKFVISNPDDGQCITIRDGGNIGIQENSPTSRLEIKSAGNTSTSSALNIKDSDGNSLIFVRDDGKTSLGDTSPTALLDLNGSSGYDQLRLRTTYTPTSSTDTNGNVGDISWDDNYIYIKTSSGWKRSALGSW